MKSTMKIDCAFATQTAPNRYNPCQIAWAAVILGAFSMPAIAGVIAFLAVFTHGQSASSTV